MSKLQKKSETEEPGKPKRAGVMKSDAAVNQEANPKAETSAGQAQVVKNMLSRIEAKMAVDDIKATMGDYIRLVQLHKELDDEAPREIKVTWVEPAANKAEETESGNGE